jgi:hypothetical protein
MKVKNLLCIVLISLFLCSCYYKRLYYSCVYQDGNLKNGNDSIQKLNNIVSTNNKASQSKVDSLKHIIPPILDDNVRLTAILKSIKN